MQGRKHNKPLNAMHTEYSVCWRFENQRLNTLDTFLLLTKSNTLYLFSRHISTPSVGAGAYRRFNNLKLCLTLIGLMDSEQHKGNTTK